jgi:uncharacterized membrane protein YgdD (TMEM256/DUF423 family)
MHVLQKLFSGDNRELRTCSVLQIFHCMSITVVSLICLLEFWEEMISILMISGLVMHMVQLTLLAPGIV